MAESKPVEKPTPAPGPDEIRSETIERERKRIAAQLAAMRTGVDKARFTPDKVEAPQPPKPAEDSPRDYPQIDYFSDDERSGQASEKVESPVVTVAKPAVEEPRKAEPTQAVRPQNKVEETPEKTPEAQPRETPKDEAPEDAPKSFGRRPAKRGAALKAAKAAEKKEGESSPPPAPELQVEFSTTEQSFGRSKKKRIRK